MRARSAAYSGVGRQGVTLISEVHGTVVNLKIKVVPGQ